MRIFLRRVSLLTFCLALLLAPLAVRAQFDATVKKGEEKTASRWSLSDYITQKNKNHLSDLWLAKNSHSSLFEFYLDLESSNYNHLSDPNAISNHDVYGGSLAAYIGVFGLQAGYQADNDSRTNSFASANLRLFGHALQDTHLNLEYGLMGFTWSPSSFSTTENETVQNRFAAVSGDLYLTRHLGFEGAYRRLFPAQSNLNRSIEGEQEALGLFCDIGFARLFGNWTNEFLIFDGGGQVNSSEFRQGWGGGLRLYF